MVGGFGICPSIGLRSLAQLTEKDQRARRVSRCTPVLSRGALTQQPKAQIRHLHNLLVELGMKGTPSLSKARALKEQRELAAELGELGAASACAEQSC